jgi:hypothetical protein
MMMMTAAQEEVAADGLVIQKNMQPLQGVVVEEAAHLRKMITMKMIMIVVVVHHGMEMTKKMEEDVEAEVGSVIRKDMLKQPAAVVTAEADLHVMMRMIMTTMKIMIVVVVHHGTKMMKIDEVVFPGIRKEEDGSVIRKVIQKQQKKVGKVDAAAEEVVQTMKTKDLADE